MSVVASEVTSFVKPFELVAFGELGEFNFFTLFKLFGLCTDFGEFVASPDSLPLSPIP